MEQQTTSHILMVRPVSFRMNEQTAVNNYYQKVLDNLTPELTQQNALREFDEFVNRLREAGVEVIVVQDTQFPDTPDSVFPNNWVSFHGDGRVGLYPMYAVNRRHERREDVFDILMDDHGFHINEIVDFTEFEEHERFLEGTGSMILDRPNKVAYAALSERTDLKAFEHFCEEFHYQGVSFRANQTVNGERLPIYHTNVMMCIGEQFAVICSDTIDDAGVREAVLSHLREAGKEIIEITEEQKHRFAGNMLQVKTKDGQLLLVMSDSAYHSLRPEQIAKLESFNPILHVNIDTIEACGGGSARCMMAEIFLPQN
jgi:hypothetical protein